MTSWIVAVDFQNILLNQLIVVFMGADPDPFYGVAHQLTYSAMMITNSNRKSITTAASQFLKVEGRVIVVASPEFVIFNRQFLHVSRQRVVQFPEAARAL